MFDGSTTAVSVLELTNVVVSADVPQSTTELLAKLEPCTVNDVTAGSRSTTNGGLTDLSAGGNANTVNGCGADTPMPGVSTSTLNVPCTCRNGADTVSVISVGLCTFGF